jgi:hypothetical protein
VIGGICLGWY